MAKSLTDTQLIILAEAAKRDDLAIILPERLKGGAAQKVVDKLLAAALIEEVTAKGGFPVHRRDDQVGPVGLRITKSGMTAIGVEESDAEHTPKDGKRSLGKRGREEGPAKSRTSDVVKRKTGGVKRDRVLTLLGRPTGASIDELTSATGWLAHSTRAAITGFRKDGIQIERTREKRGKAEVSVYRIAKQAASSGQKKAGGRAQ